ncbi:MAG: hypothetical protein AABY07_01550 [Nanoarchaeota archaeon]
MKQKIFEKAVAILIGIFFMVIAILVISWISHYFDKPLVKIEDTGEKSYACTYDWQDDKVIQDCKLYPIYKEVPIN